MRKFSVISKDNSQARVLIIQFLNGIIKYNR